MSRIELPAQSWLDARIEVRPSIVHGLGLFAREPIASLDKVRAVIQVANPVDEELWLELALGADASQLTRICREVRRSLDADAPGQADQLLAKRGLWTRTREDGMLRVVALLPPEDGAIVVAALEAVAKSEAVAKADDKVRDPADEPWAARQADALVAVCESALAAGPESLTKAPGTAVVHVDVGVLTGEQPDGRCHLEDGTPVSTAVARRLCCDIGLVTIVERDGLPIDVGRRRRLFSPKQRRAMASRDQTCRYPGCPVPARRADAHHLRDWWRGGRTDIGNGCSLCAFHHARLHEGEFSILGDPGGELRFVTRGGVEIRPPLREPLAGGIASLREQHEERGLEIGPETPVAGWRGERCDIHYTVDAYAEASYFRREQAARAP